jgi:RNA polymerase sigma factor (sigma-70 family)
MSTPEDHWLVQAFDEHYDSIYAYLARRLGRSAADDLTAEVFSIACARQQQFDCRRGTPVAWLFGIASNVLHNHRRKEHHQLQLYAHEPSVIPNFDAEFDRIELASALREMKPEFRDALLLSVWGGLTYEQIAEALDVAIGTVRSHISRAKEDLRNSFDRQNKSRANAAKDAR